MSNTHRLALSIGAGVVAAAATIGAAGAGFAATPHAATPHAAALHAGSSSNGTYLNVTPHVTVSGNTITASGTFAGRVRKANTRYPDVGLALYYVSVDGRVLGGPNATSRDAGCTVSAPLVSVRYHNPAISETVSNGRHVVVVSEGFCGDNAKYRTTSATRTVTVGTPVAAKGAYLTIDPHVTVSGSTISVAPTLIGMVRSPSTSYAEADLGSYQILIDGKEVGGADPGELTCHASDPLVPVTIRNNALSKTVAPGKHIVTVNETFCGSSGTSLLSSATRTVTTGRSQNAPKPSSPMAAPTQAPTTAHLGVTG